ncbi:MAG: oligoribonuclease [bacterium]|nr:oligoribonuclease [bacterium]
METSKNLIWIDMEMTGLNVERDKILEIAIIITDSELNILDESIDLVIHQPDDILDNMNDWCKEHLGQNGLTERSRHSTITINDARKLIFKLIRKYTEEKQGLLCGNSVYVDRMFLKKFFPKIESYLNYRIIDVSSIKEVAKRWYAKDVGEFLEHKKTDLSHRALDDIKWSINELKFYREKIFK